MPSYTAQTLINNALTNLGILEQGGTPSVSDSTEALTRLNYLIQQWHLQDKFIWSIVSTLWPLSANVGTYTIGPTGTFNEPRPTFIEQPFYVASRLLAAEIASDPAARFRTCFGLPGRRTQVTMRGTVTSGDVLNFACQAL